MSKSIRPLNKQLSRILSAAGGAAVFLVLKLLLHWAWIPALLLGLIAYGILSENVLDPTKKVGRVAVDFSRYDTEKRRILTEASRHLSEMDRVLRQIRTAGIRTRGRRVFETGNRIIEYVTKYPDKMPVARRFFNYYLETASSILRRYLDIQSTRIQSDETRRMTDRTIQALEILETAFEKQFAKLMVDEILDIETDIHLLENTLNLEG